MKLPLLNTLIKFCVNKNYNLVIRAYNNNKTFVPQLYPWRIEVLAVTKNKYKPGRVLYRIEGINLQEAIFNMLSILEENENKAYLLACEINRGTWSYPQNWPYFNERIVRYLSADGINYIEDLIQKTKLQIIRIPNLGRHSMKEIEKVLAEKGLALKKI